MDIAERLKSERERIGLTQTAFGALGGAGKTTVIAWERGTAHPNASFLAAIAEAGVDVCYVITGSRDYEPPPKLTAEEQVLLDHYRAASREVRNAALGALLGARSSEGTPKQVFHGPVGQYLKVDGSVQRNTVNMPAPAAKPPRGKA